MSKAHGDDFVRVRPFGSLGDKGCDGYLQSNGQVFQCYGALNGDSGKVTYLIGKMDADYTTAALKLPAIMKEWHMVHNLVDGLPANALLKLDELKKTDTERKFGFVGIESLERIIFSLDPSEIESLLGVVATSRDAQNLQPTELRDLVVEIVRAADQVHFDASTIGTVPVEKLTFNKLPSHWHSLIRGGWQNAHHVSAYLDRHPEPLTGEKIAQMFRVRYQYLKAQHLPPGEIMTNLYEMVTGIGNSSPARQVAAQAVLAFLFESCDIFEDHPAGETN